MAGLSAIMGRGRDREIKRVARLPAAAAGQGAADSSAQCAAVQPSTSVSLLPSDMGQGQRWAQHLEYLLKVTTKCRGAKYY